ncbi:hypothetical protein QFC22_004793 [Naganishia vaughanmartiniae]|uniref:Uncharacterized protein n=1 Tax=Naganishia vaughanmartiniae TaxID=1424756 RepID=A0ACC2WZ90_9TREE|nr:hypothetical protein QFC22_004793 [Naganishia vaughanmartiniae]
MGKTKSSTNKSASKLAKKAKQEEKAAKSELKAIKGGNGKEDNLEDILAQFQQEWKTAHAVKEETQLAAPSRRLNATFTAYGDHLWLIGGEYFDGDKAMTFWKQYIVMYGGFHDTGVKTSYLSDLWIFDTETYKWKEVEMKATDRAPGASSSTVRKPFTHDGDDMERELLKKAWGGRCLFAGGYRKEYLKGSKSIGMALEDTWLLQ